MPRSLAERTVFVIGAVLLAALAALAGLLVAKSAGARGFPVDELKEGVNAANLQITPMFVIRDRTYAIAIRPFSPGATDPVVWCPREGFFESPVTGSKFSGVDGAYIAGPAWARSLRVHRGERGPDGRSHQGRPGSPTDTGCSRHQAAAVHLEIGRPGPRGGAPGDPDAAAHRALDARDGLNPGPGHI